MPTAHLLAPSSVRPVQPSGEWGEWGAWRRSERLRAAATQDLTRESAENAYEKVGIRMKNDEIDYQ